MDHNPDADAAVWGPNIELAGSPSLAVSLSTMLVGFTRCSLNQSFAALGRNRPLLLTMAGGYVVTFLGGNCSGWCLQPSYSPRWR